MTILISDLYGKQIISNTGKMVGMVEDIIVDFEEGTVSSLLLTKIEDLTRAADTKQKFAKNSVRYSSVKSVSETIVVSGGK